MERVPAVPSSFCVRPVTMFTILLLAPLMTLCTSNLEFQDSDRLVLNTHRRCIVLDVIGCGALSPSIRAVSCRIGLSSVVPTVHLSSGSPSLNKVSRYLNRQQLSSCNFPHRIFGSGSCVSVIICVWESLNTALCIVMILCARWMVVIRPRFSLRVMGL